MIIPMRRLSFGRCLLVWPGPVLPWRRQRSSSEFCCLIMMLLPRISSKDWRFRYLLIYVEVIVLTLSYCSSDLKPDNVLVQEKGRPDHKCIGGYLQYKVCSPALEKMKADKM